MSGITLLFILGFCWYSGFLAGKQSGLNQARPKSAKKQKAAQQEAETINAEFRDL